MKLANLDAIYKNEVSNLSDVGLPARPVFGEMPDVDDWLSIDQISGLLGYSPATLRGYILRGTFTAHPREVEMRMGTSTKYEYRWGDVLDWLRTRSGQGARQVDRRKQRPVGRLGATNVELYAKQPERDAWISVPEIAKLLGVSREAVYLRMGRSTAHAPEPTEIRVGGRGRPARLYRWSDIADWLAR